MEMRQNVYFIILYALMLGFIILSVILIYAKIKVMNEEIKVYNGVYDLLQSSLNSYYSGGRIKRKYHLFEDHECFSTYDSFMKMDVYCDGKKLSLFPLHYPILINIHKGNDEIYIDRGYLDYGVFKYLYMTLTNKRIIFIRFDLSSSLIKNPDVDKFFSSIFLNFPTSTIVSLYDNTHYVMMCNTKDLTKCDKDDFINMLLYYSKLYDFLKAQGVAFHSEYNKQSVEHLRLEYDQYAPLFVAFVDNVDKCGIHEDCVVVSPHGYKYIYKNTAGNIIQKTLLDGYDVLLLVYFKNAYGFYYKNGKYMIDSKRYREMWIDYLSFYAPVLGKRYELLSKKKNYSYASYNVCKAYFNNLSMKFCGPNNSVCSVTSSHRDHKDILNGLYEIMHDILGISKDILSKGCEEMTYL